MKKIFVAAATILISLPAWTMPETGFYRLQKQKLSETKSRKVSTDKRQTPEASIDSHESTDSKAFKPEIATKTIPVKNVEKLVELVLTYNPEIEKHWRLFRAAQFNLSQTQAIEPVLEQFAAFAKQSRQLVPLSKEHPLPGVSALKLEIANLIAAEAREKLNIALLDLAKRTRILAYRQLQLQGKLRLIKQTSRLYTGLHKTSESLYRNGNISLAQLTMIANEGRQLLIEQNRLKSELISNEQEIQALLNAHLKPDLTFLQVPRLNQEQQNIGEPHPEIAATIAAAQRLEKMTLLLQRASFPEFTSISSLQNRGDLSHSMSYQNSNMIKDSSIDFNRVFLYQLRERSKAARARQIFTENRLKAAQITHTASLKLARKNLHIISSQMIPELEKAFAGVKSRYENGKAGFQELIEAERRLLNAAMSRIDAEFATRKLNAEILLDLGKGSIKVGANHERN